MTGCAVSSSAGGNREKGPSGVEAAIKKRNKEIKFNTQVEKEEEEAEQQVRYRRSGRARPPSARPDFQPAELRRTNQEAIPLIAVQTKPAVALARKYI